MTDWWVIILQFQGAFYKPPWILSKQMFHRGRQVFQVAQAPSGPTVIQPLSMDAGYCLYARLVNTVIYIYN